MTAAQTMIITLHHEGLSRQTIAERLGVTLGYVLKVQRKAGIARISGRTKSTMTGGDLAQPDRADKGLRRFSWEAS